MHFLCAAFHVGNTNAELFLCLLYMLVCSLVGGCVGCWMNIQAICVDVEGNKTGDTCAVARIYLSQQCKNRSQLVITTSCSTSIENMCLCKLNCSVPKS